MPTLTAEQLHDVAQRLLVGLRVPPDDARQVAELLVEANLAGHDSHGVIRLPQYAAYVKAGLIRPAAPMDIVLETPCTAIINAHMNLGQVAMLRATDLAMQKAGQTAVATVMVRECNHIGRLGSYALRAARGGFATFLGVNGPGGRSVAPWGGIDRRMGTNPLCMGCPYREGPLVLDMTTSVVAEGKLRVYHHKKLPAPDGWLIDHEGRPTNDTNAFYGQPAGALLPLGGSVGYKGFGMSVMLDVLAGAMSGQGAVRPDLSPGHNGVWLTLWKVDAFVAIESFYEEIDKLSAFIKSSRRVPGVDEILLPGEIEARTTAARRRDGIVLPEETWSQLTATAREWGLSLS